MELCLLFWSRVGEAKKFFRQFLKGLQEVPRVIIPDQLASSAAAKKEMMASVQHRQHQG